MPVRVTIEDANMVAQPEFRSASSGMGIANIRLAVNERKKNKETGDWEDGDTTFLTCVAFGQRAERIVEEDLQPGDLVFASGVLRQENYLTREGEKRSALKVYLETFGRDYKWLDKRDKPRPAARTAGTGDEVPF